jgi:hypothetical protein
VARVHAPSVGLGGSRKNKVLTEQQGPTVVYEYFVILQNYKIAEQVMKRDNFNFFGCIDHVVIVYPAVLRRKKYDLTHVPYCGSAMIYMFAVTGNPVWKL